MRYQVFKITDYTSSARQICLLARRTKQLGNEDRAFTVKGDHQTNNILYGLKLRFKPYLQVVLSKRCRGRRAPLGFGQNGEFIAALPAWKNRSCLLTDPWV